MSYNTVVQQGRFTSDGNLKTIAVRSDIDWFRVINQSIAAANQTNAVATEFYWQRGMPADAKFSYFKSNAANAANLFQYITTAGAGFNLVDSSVTTPEAAVGPGTAISQAAPARVTLNGHGFVTGDIVRIYTTTGMLQVGGLDFTVTRVDANNFDLTNLDSSGFAAAATAVTARRIPFDPIFYPRRRFITNISQAANAIVTFSVTHGLTVGQEVRFHVSSDFGMTEINELSGTITATGAADASGFTNTVTVDIDSSAFTAFAWPASAAVPIEHAHAVPLGMDSAQALSSAVDLLGDATDNLAVLGMQLAGGAGNPGGANTNVMWWQAGKAFSVDNQ